MALKPHKLENHNINDLPEDMLIKIISHLPTKYAVATSTLSKRWINLYTKGVTHLDLCPSVMGMHYYRDKNDAFISLVTKLLGTCNLSSLVSFSLIYTHRSDESVTSWLDVVMIQKIQQLMIYFRHSYPLPVSFFTCKTLQEIVLSSCIVKIPESVVLPCLKILGFDCVEFEGNDDLTRILAGCPSIQEIKVHGSRNMERISLSAPYLVKFELRHNSFTCPSLIEINAPNLKYFKYDEQLAYKYSIKPFNALVEAQFGYIDIMACSSARQLFGAFSRVKRLAFSRCEFVQALLKFEDGEDGKLAELPILHSLTRLELPFFDEFEHWCHMLY